MGILRIATNFFLSDGDCCGMIRSRIASLHVAVLLHFKAFGERINWESLRFILKFISSK